MAANLFVEPAERKCFQNNGITNIVCTWMSFHKTAGVRICSKKKYLGGYQYCRAIGQDVVELAKRCKRGVRTAGLLDTQIDMCGWRWCTILLRMGGRVGMGIITRATRLMGPGIEDIRFKAVVLDGMGGSAGFL